MKRLLPLLLLFAVGCVSPDAKPELRLRLEVFKTRWHVGEYLWYRISLENTGKASFAIYDSSWTDPKAIQSNFDEGRWTYLDIVDAKGRPVVAGLSGVYYEDCAKPDLSRYPDRLRIRKGESLILEIRTWWPGWLFPSVRARWNEWVDKHTDKTPWGSYGEVNPGQTLAQAPVVLSGMCRASWDGGNRGSVLGDEHMRLGEYPMKLPAEDGFRVLNPFPWPLKPGRYRIKAVYDERNPLPALSVDEDIQRLRPRYRLLHGDSSAREWVKGLREEWKKAESWELEERRTKRAVFEKLNKNAVHIVSDEIEFEVIP